MRREDRDSQIYQKIIYYNETLMTFECRGSIRIVLVHAS